MKDIYLTVDVECHDIALSNLYIDGKINGELWGIEKILQVGDEESIPINFFVDIAEAFRYGDSFISSIIKRIKLHNQHVCMHLHPNFISGDDSRPFIWQYSFEEKKTIFRKALDKYVELVGEYPSAFRVGCYGMDNEMYEVIKLYINKPIIDLSYSYSYGACHASIPSKTLNYRINEKITVLPNTRYLGFCFGKMKKYVNLDITSSNFNEMKRVIALHKQGNITCTMHSWNLFKHFFYKEETLRKDRRNLRKMYRFISISKKNGYVFQSFNHFDYDCSSDDQDLKINKGIVGFILSLANTFTRMQRVGRMNRKYFCLYCLFYLSLGAIATVILLLIK